MVLCVNMMLKYDFQKALSLNYSIFFFLNTDLL